MYLLRRGHLFVIEVLIKKPSNIFALSTSGFASLNHPDVAIGTGSPPAA
jgi:hypothetical protein